MKEILSFGEFLNEAKSSSNIPDFIMDVYNKHKA
jgi:hypothetical protein